MNPLETILKSDRESAAAFDIVTFRRDLHKHPELRFEEHRTADKVASLLANAGWLVHKDPESTGLLVTDPEGDQFDQVLIRADLDAYPVTDSKVTEYASSNPGVTHACGHDVHTSAAVGLALRVRSDTELRRRVSFLFQPAEEIPYGEASGARRMLDSGLLRDRYVAVLGMHCWPQLEAGTVGLDHGPAMAAKDAFGIEIRGRSAHAATPALGRDAILGAAAVISALHAGVARERNPHELVAFNIGTIRGGQSQSALAELVTLTGTLRTHDEQVRSRLKSVIERVAHSATAAFDLHVTLTWANEMPAVVNAPELVALAHSVLSSAGISAVSMDHPPLTTDDFSLLAVLGPSLYVKLGVTAPGATTIIPLHTAGFDVDESCLTLAVDALEALTRGALDPERTVSRSA